jgi:hypothetical protein
MNQLVPVQTNGQEFRQSTDAAGLCGAIVKQTARNIQGRRYVTVEGWQAIAIAHGCTASADHVERVSDEGTEGFKCVGVVRRMSDGAEIARAEGFLGDDENTWNKRPVYARRAMVQTRAISRACRSAFAHVVVMIDAGLSTTPAEEVPEGGFVEGQFEEVPQRQVSPSEPANLKQQLQDSIAQEEVRAPRNWGGRYPTKTALRKARTTHHAELERIGVEGTFDDLDEYLTSPEYVDYIKIAGEHFPLWLEGAIPPELQEQMPPEYVQTFKLEQKARDMIAVRGNGPADPQGAE